MKLFFNISELYTPFKRIEQAAIAVTNGTVAWIGPYKECPETFLSVEQIDLQGKAVLPGLVDCHTHLVWAGSRLEEYLQRAKGESYEQILAKGGGIYNTVKATQLSTEDELFALAKARAEHFLQEGITSLEIKSGYGLEPVHELKMLKVIRRLNDSLPQHIIATFLAHVIPKTYTREHYVTMLCQELIPEIKQQGLAEAVDVFCDQGAFTLTETRQLLETAQEHGLFVKAHAEQLSHTGASSLVAELRGLSADHLEVSQLADWQAMAKAGTVATLLPGASLVLGKALPDVSTMADMGLKIAIASDHNPGSSPLYSLMLCLQLTTALSNFSVEQALTAGTAHAADALARPQLGRLQTNSEADFIVLSGHRALEPFYTWGKNLVAQTFIGGEQVSCAG